MKSRKIGKIYYRKKGKFKDGRLGIAIERKENNKTIHLKKLPLPEKLLKILRYTDLNKPTIYDSLKKMICKRDNYTCQKCNTKEWLLIHHIDQNRKNNNEENLITLCQSCHAKIHNDKDFTLN